MNRFRLFTLAIALFIITLPSAMQAQIIKGEVFFGGNASQVDGDECFGYKKIGVHAGAGALIPITNWMDVGLEVLFNQKGAYKRDSITYGNAFPHAYNLSLNYAEVPVMIYFTDKDKVSFGIGVSYGRVVGIKELVDRQPSQYKDYGDVGIGLGDGQLHWKNGFNDPDLSGANDIDQLAEIVYGAGIPSTIDIAAVVANSCTYRPHDFNICADLRFRVWEGFHVELRYQYSLAPIRTRLFYQNAPETLAMKIRHQYNNSITLRVVYIFNEHRSKGNKAETKAKQY